MIEMHGNIVGLRRVIHEEEPLHNVALNGVRNVVHGVRAVGETEVDDGGGARVGAGHRSRKRLEACRSLWVQSGARLLGRTATSSA